MSYLSPLQVRARSGVLRSVGTSHPFPLSGSSRMTGATEGQGLCWLKVLSKQWRPHKSQ